MKTETQDQLVLNHLKKGNRISTLLAFKLWNHTRLSRSIHTLRQDYDIQDEWVEHAGTRYKTYFLTKN